MVKLLSSQASEPDDERWWTLAGMLEFAAGTLATVLGPLAAPWTAPRRETLQDEAYSREEIYKLF